MTLKKRIAVFVTLLFSVLYGIMAIAVIIIFSDFVKEEFHTRLRQKAVSTLELLLERKDGAVDLIKTIDKEKVDNLIDEKNLVFDDSNNLIYSNLEAEVVSLNKDDSNLLKTKKEFFRKQELTELYGTRFFINGKVYYVLISASDKFGLSKLNFLTNVLLFSFFVFCLIAWIITGLTIQKLLYPLSNFIKKIKSINENNLDERIEVKSNKNEIDLIANEFNLMMVRISKAIKYQSEFTAYASHELRTPIARIIAQIENTLQDEKVSKEAKDFLKILLAETNQIAELIYSLLILSKHNSKFSIQSEPLRVDEVIYTCIEKIKSIYPDCKIFFDLIIENESEEIKEIFGNRTSLEIVFVNLFKNAYIYSEDKCIDIQIIQKKYQVECLVTNQGKIIPFSERDSLFKPFMRGENASGITGFGLGLRIVESILQLHNAPIVYEAPNEKTNIFKVIFSLNF
jgi:signal transduction histidine kinase